MSPHETLPRRLREFLALHLGSVEEVEILLLLWRTKERWWRADEVGAQLHLGESTARTRLEKLSGHFLDVRVAGDVCFRYSPGNQEREERTAELAAAYEEHRTDVIGLVMSGRSARDFADAFRLKKEDE
jgi:hypothetical protein